MEEQGVSYTNGDIVVFDQFGDAFQSTEDSGKWTVQQRFASMNMVVLVICYQGKVQLRLNGRDYEASVGQGLACLPIANIERLMVTPDVHVRGFGFSVTAMESMFHTYRRTWQDALSLNENPLLQLSEEQMEVAEHLYQIVLLAKRMESSPHYSPMIRSLVQSFLYLLADMVNNTSDSDTSSLPQREQQFKHFVQLLWASGGKVRSVSYFANQMCITAKYLSVIVREACGKTPMQMIHSYSANMIAQLLRGTDMSIKEIAHEMNFKNGSFFGRYVKQHLGYPPKEYRELMKNDVGTEMMG